jgi:hypothetical protein
MTGSWRTTNFRVARESCRVEDEVVTVAVSVGLGHAEAEAGGFEGEGEFGELSAALGGEFAGSLWGGLRVLSRV